MKNRIFLDTNVLIYADDVANQAKRDKAKDVIKKLTRSGKAVLSTQVLKEYFAIATTKLKLAPDVARGRVEVFSQLDVIVVRTDLILQAIDLHRLNSISFWDALIVRAAAVGGCSELLTEDLQHGQRFDGVQVVNPFLV